ncbi:glyoxalase [Sphingobacterium alkalisoli]|uniref:Glyoxalase n=1 Tax=Sphingobacterium alkalisoli TaxID=1874115 RepID=A0A4U0H4M5_9SPHI|nr:VOC family protein [Sphingobacterium alkalisoli]TJY66667.1 glyoxalase [Sphingobacterium alkalisoli]GGH14932.1 glyoxalase [Sphingobacterium alkalisoli]
MKVKRIVTNVSTQQIDAANRFYGEVLGLDILMDYGWITSYGNTENMHVQIAFAMEGGAGTDVPDVSIEVDDVEVAYARMKEYGYHVEYGPVDESWGVRRFYVRDPFGKLINILMHL